MSPGFLRRNPVGARQQDQANDLHSDAREHEPSLLPGRGKKRNRSQHDGPPRRQQQESRKLHALSPRQDEPKPALVLICKVSITI